MNIGRILSTAAEHHADRPAFIWGDRMTTYAQANARADALACGLQDLGLNKGDRVGVFMYNRPQLIESFFATWKAGGCVVPLNARFVAEEVSYHLKDSEATAIIFGEEFREMISEIRGQLPPLKHFICTGSPLDGQISYERIVSDLRESAYSCVDVSDDDLAWLFYTSGTTGRPKGAMLTHGNLTFMAVGWVADLMHLEPEDVGLHAAPLTHGAGFHSVALTLKAASQVILKAHRFEPENFFATVERHRVTNTWLVPTQIKILLNYPGIDKWDISSLKWVVYGGAPMYVEDLKEAIRRMGHVFVQLYGQGETPMTGTYLRPQEHVLEGPESTRLVSCGQARSGIEVKILSESDKEVPRGQAGEICVRGPTVMEGYWRRPEATAESLRGGWLHTGDVGSMDEQGYVYILDRTKDMIISGGSNVYPREVEEVLLRHPAVSEVCVIGVPDEFWGEAVKAVVVLKEGAAASADEIIRFAALHMADYKKPKSVDFVAAIPRNAYGKVLKRELREQYWASHGRKV
ncbi:MAG TPA: long-chain-fatty-acid--CoA ligase [Blastocatellia bacterium]|nr:long-chain-fatty-acid--CoA ligase [Blastocatellia bacterium]